MSGRALVLGHSDFYVGGPLQQTDAEDMHAVLGELIPTPDGSVCL